MGNHRTGYAGGLTDGTANMDKLQDPVLLADANTHCPFYFWNADNVTLSGTNVTAVTNLLGTKFNPLFEPSTPTITVNGDPLYVPGAVNNNRAAITFDGNDSIGVFNDTTANKNLTLSSEMTLMLVCRADVANTVMFSKTDETTFPGTGTSGDLIVRVDANKNFQVTYLGGVYSGFNYDEFTTNDPKVRSNQWVILTIKAQTKRPNGRGSEIEIYVNGTRDQIDTGIPTLIGFDSDTFQNRYIQFGNGSSLTGGGNSIAAGLITGYWINESQQIRLENYFRDYYGTKF
jgi:hypothetical protein